MRSLLARPFFAAVAGGSLFVGSVFVGTTAAHAAPALTATPNSSLVDGQLINAVASGLTSARPFLAECSGATEGTCELLYEPPGDPTSMNATVRARASVLQLDGTVVDCRTSACSLAVIDLNAGTSSLLEVSTPLTFDPSAPLQPIPPLTVTPNVHVVDGNVVHVTSPAYFNPNQVVTLTVCRQSASDLPTQQLHCGLVLHQATANGTGVLDTAYTFSPSGDEVTFPHATAGTCLVENGCRFVGAAGGSLPRMLLGPVLDTDPNATTTTTTRPTTTSTPTVVATPRFTG